MKTDNLNKFFESIFNEARSTKLYYIGRKTDSGWQFMNDEAGHKKAFRQEDADAALKSYQKKFPNSTFEVFDENDPEVLKATKDKAIAA